MAIENEETNSENNAEGLILTYLTTDWQSRIIDGPKNKGGTLYFRYGVTATSYGWALTEFRKGTPPIGRVHASRFADLTPSFKTKAGLDPFECMKVCALSLSTKNKSDLVEVSPTGNSLQDAMALAEKVDSTYKTNFNTDENVRSRYFGEDKDEE